VHVWASVDACVNTSDFATALSAKRFFNNIELIALDLQDGLGGGNLIAQRGAALTTFDVSVKYVASS